MLAHPLKFPDIEDIEPSPEEQEIALLRKELRRLRAVVDQSVPRRWTTSTGETYKLIVWFPDVGDSVPADEPKPMPVARQMPSKLRRGWR